MSKYQALIDALKAGPTDGKWNWDCDPVKNDPIGRTRYRVTTIGKTVAQIYYSSYEGGPTNAAQDAAYIAAANPATIRSILADLERAEKALADVESVMYMDDAGQVRLGRSFDETAFYAALSQLKGVQ